MNTCSYKAFFGCGGYDCQRLKHFADEIAVISKESLNDNYVSLNYGGKYFGYDNILLASLLYSFDRCANTIGHYDAYIKKNPQSNFVFEFIEPLNSDIDVKIYRDRRK